MAGPVASPWMIAALLGGVVGFAIIKLLWGAALWTKKSDYRIGERWGHEAVEVAEWSGGKGLVSAGGELWRATSKDALAPGDRVVVQKVKGLTLEVRKG